MKKIYASIAVAIMMICALADYKNSSLTANTGGSPLGHSGSPFDGRACNSCHSGPSPTNQPGWITSNIPAEGYVPGATYTITATATRSGTSKFGFQVAAKTSSGAQAGTLRSISSETNAQSGGRSITHSSFGTLAGNDSKTWVFEWIAPNSGSGQITFFGAFLATNNNGSSSGDITSTSNLSVQQRTSTSISANTSAISELVAALYPNPASNMIALKVRSNTAESLDVFLLDITGREMGSLYRGEINQGESILSLPVPQGLPSGLYTLVAKTSSTVSTRKLQLK